MDDNKYEYVLRNTLKYTLNMLGQKRDQIGAKWRLNPVEVLDDIDGLVTHALVALEEKLQTQLHHPRNVCAVVDDDVEWAVLGADGAKEVGVFLRANLNVPALAH